MNEIGTFNRLIDRVITLSIVEGTWIAIDRRILCGKINCIIKVIARIGFKVLIHCSCILIGYVVVVVAVLIRDSVTINYAIG